MRRIVVAALAAAAFGTAAAPAAAVEPVRLPPLELNNVVQDQGQACGFPVRWDIHLTVERTRYYDNDGTLLREIAHIREDNTITNLSTGLTLRDGPDAFTQTTYFNPDGTVSHFVATGLAVNVFGEQLKDVGRVVWLPRTNEIVFSAGPHPVREAVEFGNFRTGLRAFCDVLA